jgi:orotate phosphoribosyltransferase
MTEQEIKQAVCRALVEIKAVHYFKDGKPFVFTSGTHAPCYVDLRKLISFPKQRSMVLDFAKQLVSESLRGEHFDVVAGGETAGIPYGAWMADRLNLPFIYVRKKAKEFGGKKQIEGDLAAGQNVLLVEDLMFDAGSKVFFAEAIRAAGARIGHCLIVFDYGNPKSRETLSQSAIQAHALANWPALLQVTEADGYFNSAQIKEIKSFLDNPQKWSGAHAA